MNRSLEHESGNRSLLYSSPTPRVLSRLAIVIALSQNTCNERIPEPESRITHGSTSTSEKVTRPSKKAPEEDTSLPKPTLYGADPSQLDPRGMIETQKRIEQAERSISLVRPHAESDNELRIIQRMRGCADHVLTTKKDEDEIGYKGSIDDFVILAKRFCGKGMPPNVSIINDFGGTSWNVICEPGTQGKDLKCPDSEKQPRIRL